MSRNLIRTVILLVAIVAMTAVGVAQAAPGRSHDRASIAVEHLAKGALELESKVPFERAVVTLSGPGNLKMRHVFGAGEKIAVPLVARDGKALPNGQYRYTLHVSSNSSRGGVKMGLFYIDNGQAVSRHAKRSELGAIRQGLNRDRAERKVARQEEAAGPAARGGGGNQGYYASYGYFEIYGPRPALYFSYYYYYLPRNPGASGNETGYYGDYIMSAIWQTPYNPGPPYYYYGWMYQINYLGTIADFAYGGGIYQGAFGGDIYNLALSGDIIGSAVGGSYYYPGPGGNGPGNGGTIDLFAGFYNDVYPTVEGGGPFPAGGNIYLTSAFYNYFYGPVGAPVYGSAGKIHLTGIYGNLLDKPTGLPPGFYSSRLTVAPSGVGIGTEYPTAELEIQDDDFAAFRLYSYLGGNTWSVSANPGGQLTFNLIGTGGQEVTVNDRLDATGKSTLQVEGSVQATNFVFSSSKELKTEIATLDGREILERLAKLPISEWRFDEAEGGGRHIGPMAEDFHAAFQLGKDARHISVLDASGVALAAIQGLHEMVESQKDDLAAKNESIAELRDELEALKKEMRTLSAQKQ